MITVPLWIVVLAAVLIITAIAVWHEERTSSGWGSLGGCVFALVGVIAALVVLLVHAWGWL